MFRNLLVFIYIFSFAGCAIQPLPRDFSRLPTAEIVNHIRCETQRALNKTIYNYLINFRPAPNLDVHVPTSRVGHYLKKRAEENINQLTKAEELELIAQLHPLAQKRIDKFRKTEIGYRFMFRITEDNDNGGDMKLSMPFTNGTVSLLLASGKKKTRLSETVFRTIETFSENINDLDCSNKEIRAPQFVYPITGEIGVEHILQTYVALSLNNNLSATSKDVDEFRRRLTFTTKLTASGKPKLVLSPIADQFRVTEVNLSSSHERTDEHEVTIAIAAKEENVKASKQGKSRGRQKKSANRILDTVEAEDTFRRAFENIERRLQE